MSELAHEGRLKTAVQTLRDGGLFRLVDGDKRPWLAGLGPPLVAHALQTALWGLIDPLVWFFFYPAVFVSSWLGGRRAGVVATVVSVALVWAFFLPDPSLANAPRNLFSTGAFFVMGLLFGTFHERLRHANRALEEELVRRTGLAADNARLFRDAQDAIRARDEFLQIASHELKTPLTPLQLHLDTLTRSFAQAGVQNERLLEKLSSATRQTIRLGRLVEGLLDVSRITGGHLELELERFDLAVAVRDVVDRFRAEAERAGSEVSVSGSDSVVGTWDSLRVEQIVSNLLINAIKYGSGKPIDIEVRATDDAVRVAVTDRGIGIEKETIGRLFGRFERGVSLRHYGGLGLGLFVARQFAEAHGGTIVAQSQLGEGSTFTLVLPRQPTDVVAAPSDEANA